jgi:hypothetical protein
MSTNLRVGKIAGAFWATLLACGVVACTSSDTTGGTGGTAGGGASGAGGSAGGTTGATTAAATGKLCPLPTQALITDFTYAPLDGGSTSSTDPRFTAGAMTGGGSSYGPTLKSDVSQGAWHFTGSVSDYSGFNIYFDNCDIIDASKYKGITFTISGNVAQGINMGVGTLADKASAAWLISKSDTQAKATDAGSCTPTSGDNRYYTPGCQDPQLAIPVTAAPSKQSILWTDLAGGSPLASPDPKALTSIYWNFLWTGAGETPYDVDLVVDDLKFVE